MGVGYVGGACRGRNRGGRAVWDGARESGNCSCGGIVCDVCRSKSEVVVLVFDARQGSLLKDSPGLSVPGHTQSHEDGRAAGAKGGIWCEGGCPCSYPFLIAVGGQWWWPRSFLEMEIFAFSMFSTLARRDRPTKPTFSRSLNFAAALAWFAAASSFGLGGASKRAKHRISRCVLDLSTSNGTDRAGSQQLGGPKLDAYYSPSTSPHHPSFYNTTAHLNTPQIIERDNFQKNDSSHCNSATCAPLASWQAGSHPPPRSMSRLTGRRRAHCKLPQTSTPRIMP